MKYIDNFLNGITMYRLMFYYLILLVLVAVVYCFIGFFAFNPFWLIISSLFFVTVCYVANKIFAYFFKIPVNIESAYITALILSLIVTPASDVKGLGLLLIIGILAMASKYVLSINRKHIFNPAAFAVSLTAILGIGSASWWIGTLPMLPFLLLGVLIVRKIRRFDLVFYFFVTSLLTIAGLSFLRGTNPLTALRATFSESPILFFAFVMLTEPLTTPPTKVLQSIYGAIIGVLFSPQISFNGIYTTPEIALLAGNIFSYIVSPKVKFVITLKEKLENSSDLFDFIFPRPRGLVFTPGQYMEWTMAHKGTDSRGDRRYFTVASSPTEDTVRLGVRFYPNGSSFKRALQSLKPGSKLLAGQLAGDFILPKDKSKKLVFIAGGIGITPFRSITKYLVDKDEKRDIVFFHTDKNPNGFIYKDVFEQAKNKLGMKKIDVITDEKSVPSGWNGGVGHIDSNMVKKEVPDFESRIFYISGSHAMVEGTKQTLSQVGVASKNIIVDYFPGY